MPLENLNFAQCFLCQSDDGSDLTDPMERKQSSNDTTNPHASIANLLLKWTIDLQDEYPLSQNLSELHALPGGLAHFLNSNRALYHKKCRNKLDKQKLDRALERVEKAKKRASSETVPVPTKVKITRTKSGSITSKSEASTSNIEQNVCFFCDEPGSCESFHRAATFGVDYKVRKSVT